jgi:Co/Zn/Cd efflux system component
MLKGLIMAAFGIGVLAEATMKALSGVVPAAETMGVIGAVALLANVFCLVLLFRHRSDDVNMRSTWLCSRNDIVANVGVLGAAALVAITQTNWPDIIIGSLIALLFFASALTVLQESLAVQRGR